MFDVPGLKAAPDLLLQACPGFRVGFVGGPWIDQGLLGRPPVMAFARTRLLRAFTLRAPRACFVPIDLLAIALCVRGASFLGGDGGTVLTLTFGLLLMLARLPCIARPERAWP